MKKSLLATVAVAALIAGHGFAYAEGAPKQEGPKQEAPAQKTEAPTPAPSAQQKAPAEKMAPANKGAENNKASDSKPMTTGQGQSGSQMSQDQKNQKADPAPQRSTTGQGGSGTQQQRSSEPSRGATPPPSGSTTQQPNAQQQGGTSTGTQQQGAQQGSGTQQQQTTGSAPSSGGVTLTSEQKTQIRSTVLTGNAPRVTNVNFSISVGTVVPRTVRVVAVPDTIVRIHPAWRGYRYFVYNDEIIIVEPDTLRIVAVLVV